MQLWSEQSGLKASLGALGAMSVGAAAAGLVGGWTCVNAAAGLVFALAGAAMPWLYVEVRRKQRVWQLTLQLPDAFDAMSRALRVGQTTTAAFQRVAQDFQSPVRDEFAYCWEQQHLGIATDVSLRDLARRSGILEMQIFAVALIMAGVTGANLAELLSKLSGLIRTRIKLRAKVRALTGESRMQAVVLSVLPLIIFIALWFLNREYASQLLRHRTLLLGTIASVALGAVWINRIVVNVAR
jgi:tight adherence protein B